jgi:hypothetical protein
MKIGRGQAFIHEELQESNTAVQEAYLMVHCDMVV